MGNTTPTRRLVAVAVRIARRGAFTPELRTALSRRESAVMALPYKAGRNALARTASIRIALLLVDPERADARIREATFSWATPPGGEILAK